MKVLVKIGWILMLLLASLQMGVAQDDVTGNQLWTDIVTSKPDSYVETTDASGKTTITLKDEKALAWLASVAGGSNGATQSSFENTEVILDADVNMSAHVWNCIPNFNGFFNGNKKSITGLRIANNTPNGFAFIKNLQSSGEIRNLNFKESDLNLTEVKSTTAIALVVENNYGLILNCSNSGNLYASTSYLSVRLAGVVAVNYGTVSNCINEGTVVLDYSECKPTAVDYQATAGIVAWSKDNSVVADCINLAAISGCSCTGGIVGAGAGEIRNCGNRGDVSGGGSYCAGIIASIGSHGKIINSYNIGSISGNKGVASFVGYRTGGSQIFNCYSASSASLFSQRESSSVMKHVYWDLNYVNLTVYPESYLISFKEADTSQENDWSLSYEVYGTTDLVEALNAWVAEQDTNIYSSWAVDENMENGGYPILKFVTSDVELSSSLWTDIVTSKPDSYIETTDASGKTTITLKDERALAWLASVAAGYNGATQSSFENTEVVLSASVNMSAYVWSCIPNFNGYFNGNKKSITGLRIANNTPNGFAMIATLGEKGEIRNLNLKETDLMLTDVKGYIASLVRTNYGLIQGCSNEGFLSVTSDNRGVHLGGLVSLNYGSVINCYNKGIVSFDCSTCINNIDYQSTAGIVAYPRNGSIISDCINFATIEGCSCTGGIAGLGSGVIRNSGNRGDIYGNGSYVGGVSGVFAGEGFMQNSYNTADVKGNASVGSLIGYQGSSSVVNCYSACKRPLRGAKEGTTSLQYIYWNSDSLTANESKESFLLSFKEADYSQGCDWTLSTEVLGTTDLLTALNNWVIQQDSSIYSGWKVVNIQTNKGYPILEYGYDPFNQYDTLTVDTVLTLCTKTQYGSKQYTVNDEGTVQPVVMGNKYFTNPTLHIKNPDFSKVKVHRPSLICASDNIKVYAEGAESYVWIQGVDTFSTSDVLDVVLKETTRFRLVAEIDGCYRTYNTDIKLNEDSILIEMGGWGDVIAIKNPNSLYSSYQWYRDGELLEDEMGQFYYEPGGLSPGLYSVDIFDTLGNLVPICPLLIERESVKSSIQNLSIYPNPSLAMQPTYVDVGDNFLDGTVLVVSDEAGMEILRKNVYSRFSEIKLSSGYYVVSVYLSDKKILSDKILVK